MTTIFSLPVDTIRTRIFNARQDTERVRVIAAAATTAASGSGGALTLGAPTFAATGVGSANIAEGSSGHGGRPHMETPKAIKYDGAIDCMVRTLRTEGVRGLYKGYVHLIVPISTLCEGSPF